MISLTSFYAANGTTANLTLAVVAGCRAPSTAYVVDGIVNGFSAT